MPPPAFQPPTDARVAFEGLEVRGSLSRAPVRRALARLKPALRQCYLSATRRAGAAGVARLDLRFVIDEDGRVRRPQATGSGLAGLSGCVGKALGRARSRSRPDTGTVEVTLKAQFTPVSP